MQDAHQSLPDRAQALRWMTLAVDVGQQSQAEPGRSGPTPKVGAVAVGPDGTLLATAYRGEIEAGEHAEFGLLQRKLAGRDLAGTTLYTTLEPCTTRGAGKTPCANRIIDRQIATVYIGMYDPNPEVYRMGWRRLRDAGISLKDFTRETRDKVRAHNTLFAQPYVLSVGDRGVAVFDWTQNGGKHRVETGNLRFETAWTRRGRDSIYAYGGHPGRVASMRFAHEFDEVDDPGAYDWADTSVAIDRIGDDRQVVAFREDDGESYLLVTVIELLDVNYGDHATPLRMEYEVRPADPLRTA